MVCVSVCPSLFVDHDCFVYDVSEVDPTNCVLDGIQNGVQIPHENGQKFMRVMRWHIVIYGTDV